MILYVEDDELLRLTVAELLETEGWRVETCADGVAALALVESETHYDLFLFDNHLPGLTGAELAARARGLEHRRRTPVLIISATECGREARRAGADEFLKKPEGINQLAGVCGRLLSSAGARR
jgi:CheY-like chemotaxis protein